jgi:hypothetical protein
VKLVSQGAKKLSLLSLLLERMPHIDLSHQRLMHLSVVFLLGEKSCLSNAKEFAVVMRKG